MAILGVGYNPIDVLGLWYRLCLLMVRRCQTDILGNKGVTWSIGHQEKSLKLPPWFDDPLSPQVVLVPQSFSATQLAGPALQLIAVS